MLHCDDDSDELNCDMIQIPNTGYDPKVPPIRKVLDGTGASYPNIDVEVSISLLKIMDIDEEDSIISILFNICLKWTDPLLKFNFLKQEKTKNLITKDELKNIWTPQIKFSLLEKDSFEQLEEQITVEKNGRPTKNNEFSISPNEVRDLKAQLK